MGLLKNPLLDP